MKKLYIAPAACILSYDTTDLIALSLVDTDADTGKEIQSNGRDDAEWEDEEF